MAEQTSSDRKRAMRRPKIIGLLTVLLAALALGCVDPADIEVERNDSYNQEGNAVLDMTLTNKSGRELSIWPSSISDIKAIDRNGRATPGYHECSTLDDTDPDDPWEWAVGIAPNGGVHSGTLCFPGISTREIEYIVVENDENYLIYPWVEPEPTRTEIAALLESIMEMVQDIQDQLAEEN